MIIILIDRPRVTHNGHVALSEAGQIRTQKRIAERLFAKTLARYPDAHIVDIRFGGKPYRGRMLHSACSEAG